MSSPMGNLVNGAQKAATAILKDAKAAQLAKNTINTDEYTGACLTTDHGTKVSDTDNW